MTNNALNDLDTIFGCADEPPTPPPGRNKRKDKARSSRRSAPVSALSAISSRRKRRLRQDGIQVEERSLTLPAQIWDRLDTLCAMRRLGRAHGKVTALALQRLLDDEGVPEGVPEDRAIAR